MVKTSGNVHKYGVGNFAVAGSISRIFIIQNERSIKVGFHFRKNRTFSMRVTNWNYITDKSDITMQSDISVHSKKLLVMLLQPATVRVFLFTCFQVTTFRL